MICDQLQSSKRFNGTGLTKCNDLYTLFQAIEKTNSTSLSYTKVILIVYMLSKVATAAVEEVMTGMAPQVAQSRRV